MIRFSVSDADLDLETIMQAEIDNVIRAYEKEATSEEKMLMAFLSALAVRSEVRKKTTYEMAQGVYECIRLVAKEEPSRTDPTMNRSHR